MTCTKREVMMKALELVFPKLSVSTCAMISEFMFSSSRPLGFRCAVMSQHHVVNFKELYNTMRNFY